MIIEGAELSRNNNMEVVGIGKKIIFGRFDFCLMMPNPMMNLILRRFVVENLMVVKLLRFEHSNK